MVGQTVGKYRILDRVGRGGMGTVYRATDETLHRDVAIKVLNAELNDPEIARRFRAEAITVARLSHPGIATIYELFEHDGQWLMVMEFVRGETLEVMASRMGPLSAQRSAELCMQALAALTHAHSMGVVHRDLKPANLMITENGTVKVMDFGIARVSGSEHLTNVGFMMGTPAYMAPEQVSGGEVDARADLYAMGVVFYRLTTAKLPFSGNTPFAMAQSQLSETPTPVGLVRGDLPPWVEEVVVRALAKAPEQRFQSAAEFHEALARCLAGLPLSSMYTPAIGMTLTPGRPMSSGAFPGHAMPTPAAAYPMPTPMPTPMPPPMATPMPTPMPAPAQAATSSQPTMVASGAMPAMLSSASDPTMAAGSGATLIPPAPEPAPAQPVSPPVKTAGPPGSGAASGKKKPIPVMWIGLAGAAVLAIVIVAALMFRRGATPDAIPEVTPAETPAPTPAETPALTPVVSPEPTETPARTPAPVGSRTASPAPVKATPSASPAARRGAAPAGSPTPAPTSTSTSTPTPTSAPAAGRGAPPEAKAEADLLVTFTDVKLYVVAGKDTTDKDAVLNFGGGQLMIMPSSGGAAMAALPYKRITAATYVHGRDPQWDAKLASPPDGLNVGSFMRPSRHWLVLQGADHFEILRLEDNNFTRILQTFEARTGIKIARPK